MPSVDELLNAAEITEATLTETNDKIEIDADTRTMIIPDTERIFGVMSDEKGERKYFRCKRFVGNGIDLSKLSLRIVFQNASGLDTGKDKYIVTDLATDGEDYVTFSWELSRKVTAYKGIISFIVCAIKTKSDGTITNEWNTTLANGIVLEGLEANGTQEQEEVARDYYNQLEAELLRVANERKTELEKKAQEAIKTIPSDYTQMQKDVNKLKEDIDYQADKFSIIKFLDKVILLGQLIKTDGTIDTVGGEYNLVKVNVLNEPRIHVKGNIYLRAGASYEYVSYAFVDNSGAVIDYAKFDTKKSVDEWLECPNNSAYVLFSVETNSLNDFELYSYSSTSEELDKKEDKSSVQNIKDDISLIDSVKKYLISGNTKVDYNFVVGETFKEFRTKVHNIIKNFKCQLYDNIVYQWQMKTTNSFAHQYGTNIQLSIGHIDEKGNIKYYAQNILALTNFSHPNMSNANYIRIDYTDTWTNVVDNQSIDYINIFQLSDGDNYSGFFLTDCKPLTNYWHNKIGDSIGDSITGQGFFQKYVKNYFGLQYFYNHGIGGTKMSGGTTEYGDAMWMDSRVNALSPYADFITVMGGQNDTNVEIGNVDISNSDTDTYCGAFNVLISKLLYKYCKCTGYYSGIDYSGITQIDIAKYVTVIPMTPFYVPNTTSQLEEKADAIRNLSRMWSLKIADLKSECGSNFGVADIYWGTDRTHPLESFYRDRIAPIIISVMENNKPVVFN